MSPINPNMLELLIALKNNPHPNSKYLEEKFKATPAIIEAWMNTLSDLKLSIRNYQWDTCFLPLDIPKLKQALHLKNLNIDYRITIPSTHLYLKEAKETSPSPIICIAEHQSAGIGQRQKSWASPFGNNLYFSLKINTKRRPQDLSGLSLVVALSIVNVLQMPELQIKWPNDIYAEHQKLAGILIDLGQKQGVGSSIIISIGINVNQIDDLVVDNQWSSLQKIRGESLNRTDILIKILNQLTDDLEKFEANGFLAFQKLWAKFDYLYQREIMIMQVDRTIYGQALGVDDIGRLILKNEEGKILHLNFGQASIKPQF